MEAPTCVNMVFFSHFTPWLSLAIHDGTLFLVGIPKTLFQLPFPSLHKKESLWASQFIYSCLYI
jgi:hypothetical protein